MNFGGLIFLLITQYFTGRGLLYLFRSDLKPLPAFLVSMFTGVVMVSFYPFLLQLMHIPITAFSVSMCIGVITILVNISSLKKYNLSNLNPANWKFNIQLYEVPFLLLFALLLFISAWRCFYLPTFARDMLSGPEAVAEFTVKEKTMVNSVYWTNLESTNNHLKPPFVTDLQIVYKLLVYPFGEIWLSLIALPFLIWMYTVLKEKLHPLLVTLVMLFFLIMPDPYAYTFIVLFDYSNMVLFFAGFYFFAQYLDNKQYSYFLYSVLMFGFATYIRPETLILCGMTVPLLLYYFNRDKVPVKKMLIRSAVFMIVPFFLYYIWTGFFVKYFLPVPFDVNNQIMPGKVPFWGRLTDMTKILIFGISDNPNQKDLNIRLYGYFIYLFLIILVVDLIFFRKKFNTEARVMLYAIAVVYIGLPFMAYLIPWIDLTNTTKRGLYKMFPPMLIYMRSSGLLVTISEVIKKWELPKITAAKPTPKPQPAVQQQGPQKSKKKGK
jgi:hypothetical protein